MENKELKIIPPEGYKIDKERSTSECIRFKPIKWTLEDNDIIGYVMSNNDSKIVPIDTSIAYSARKIKKNLFATEKLAKSAQAMAQISQIIANDERFGGPITDKEWKSPKIWHTIVKGVDGITDKYRVYGWKSNTSYSLLAFHTPEQRDLFLKENLDLVKDYLMID